VAKLDIIPDMAKFSDDKNSTFFNTMPQLGQYILANQWFTL